MANATQQEDGDWGMFESKRYDVGSGLKITLPYEVKSGSVYIRGLEEAQSSASGKFVVSITASNAST